MPKEVCHYGVRWGARDGGTSHAKTVWDVFSCMAIRLRPCLPPCSPCCPSRAHMPSAPSYLHEHHRICTLRTSLFAYWYSVVTTTVLAVSRSLKACDVSSCSPTHPELGHASAPCSAL